MDAPSQIVLPDRTCFWRYTDSVWTSYREKEKLGTLHPVPSGWMAVRESKGKVIAKCMDMEGARDAMVEEFRK